MTALGESGHRDMICSDTVRQLFRRKKESSQISLGGSEFSFGGDGYYRMTVITG